MQERKVTEITPPSITESSQHEHKADSVPVSSISLEPLTRAVVLPCEHYDDPKLLKEWAGGKNEFPCPCCMKLTKTADIDSFPKINLSDFANITTLQRETQKAKQEAEAAKKELAEMRAALARLQEAKEMKGELKAKPSQSMIRLDIMTEKNKVIANAIQQNMRQLQILTQLRNKFLKKITQTRQNPSEQDLKKIAEQKVEKGRPVTKPWMGLKSIARQLSGLLAQHNLDIVNYNKAMAQYAQELAAKKLSQLEVAKKIKTATDTFIDKSNVYQDELKKAKSDPAMQETGRLIRVRGTIIQKLNKRILTLTAKIEADSKQLNDSATDVTRLSTESTKPILAALGKLRVNLTGQKVEKKEVKMIEPSAEEYQRIQSELQQVFIASVITKDHVEKVKKLMIPGLDLNKILVYEKHPFAAFVEKSHKGRPNEFVHIEDICREFLKYTTNFNAVDKDGFTLLHWAADRGFDDLVLQLLDAGADPRIISIKFTRSVETEVKEGRCIYKDSLYAKIKEKTKELNERDKPVIVFRM